MGNTFTFDPRNNTVTAVTMVRASRQHQCGCGTGLTITLDWPQGLKMNSSITINDARCPACSTPVVLPRAHYWVENFQLHSKPIEEAAP